MDPVAALVGIPYVDKGRDPAVGLDCWGVVRQFYQTVRGVLLPSLVARYVSAFDAASVSALVADEASAWTRVAAPAFGDVVTFNVSGRPWHIGVCLGGGRFLHTVKGVGSVIERLDSPLWAPRIEGYWTYGRKL